MPNHPSNSNNTTSSGGADIPVRPHTAHSTNAASVTCPFCSSTDTELLSPFGSQLATSQYYCRACHTPFEYMRQNDE
ncbi:MAG: hypothetical protein OJF49_001443 [Ktedonobacterales bacterium]|jgi:ring-1,2-phenylacetyl-CoA epoxidase subunit PaaD|nr:MAG: hypothetical protein OJF49_001443 [Ktedonobacterales bacterium]